ncbi:WD40 repeat-like protein [Annulohypoxylon truncatum]|uniref:WD40 repeat-like protein n=1 Tax=Annulohypoxylon truncatum TaxID=327061 RepID=UPI0020074AA8|nr:WD40 repeat-like protein [Annulohypoxylon truncatum]KAI1209694.1 WD40 repeat-like protein [Annulohypoxylon truncatum]
MRSTPLIINWHDKNTPIYSAHFEPQHGKGRLATGGGDNNVRIWKVEADGDTRRVDYLSTLAKHTQAVNVVRWAPKGETLASAGDDGNVILWVPSETHNPTTFGNEGLEDKETWRAKHMFRPTAAEIYDLAWSPDATHFIIGSMDNVARIYNAGSGALIRQIAEHSHYVQGVAWDPLNEYIATQSSDRSVHIYSLKTKNGQYALTGRDDETFKVASHVKADLPPRRISSNSPAPPDMGYRAQLAAAVDTPSASIGSPVPSAPGTPQSVPLPMNPPSVVSHSRRSSFSSRRSVSPAPSLPLPAVMPMEPSPKPNHGFGIGVKNASLYVNETLTSFFRRLTFTPDGSLLLTPAGQYHVQHQDGPKPSYEVINTVYIYTRGGINRPPIAHLPGHKKPSVAIKCSPIMYTLRQSPPVTKYITIDTSSAEDPIPALPEPISKPSPAVMDPPPPPTSSAPDPEKPWTLPQHLNTETSSATPGTKMGFTLPYRMVYAVATQDSVLLYDTQQVTPICVVSNLHLATFTDLTWSSDGATLLITSSDGFCSTLSFLPGELGQEYKGELVGPKVTSAPTAAPSTQATPQPTPTSVFAPPSPFPNHQHRNSATSFAAPSPPPTTSFVSARPSSPARSNSTSSIATQVSAMNNPPLIGGNLPSITAASSGKVTGVPMTTPPETPGNTNAVVGVKREASTSEKDEESGGQPKKRRVAPTLVTDPKA